MGNYIQQNLMQPTPSADVQEKMRMCKFCIHSHISDLGYNHCWESGSFTYDGDSPMGVCWAFRDKREWKPYYRARLTSTYRGNICWAKAVHNSPAKRNSRIFKYEVIDPVGSTMATLSPKEFAKDFIPAPPGSKPPYEMKDYEKFDFICFGRYNSHLTENQERRNNHEATGRKSLLRKQ